MATPILKELQGAVASVTGATAIASGAYSASTDKLVIDATPGTGTTAPGALLADFELTPTFAAAPVTGVLQLFAVDYGLGGTAGPAPSATMTPRLVGTFNPQPQAASTLTSWTMRLNSVALTSKSDYYVYNNGTAQSINTGWILKAQCWSPGT